MSELRVWEGAGVGMSLSGLNKPLPECLKSTEVRSLLSLSMTLY